MNMIKMMIVVIINTIFITRMYIEAKSHKNSESAIIILAGIQYVSL
jgi:hypothetical protein